MTACWLVKNGVELELAFSMDPALRLAMAAAFGTFEALEFDWSHMSWRRNA